MTPIEFPDVSTADLEYITNEEVLGDPYYIEQRLVKPSIMFTIDPTQSTCWGDSGKNFISSYIIMRAVENCNGN